MEEDANSLLQQIPVLEYGNKWSEFDRRARIWLEFCGYDDILVGEEPNARADDETEAAYEARKKSWRTRDSLAYSGIRSRLGKYAKIIVGGENHLKGIMQALESYFTNILFALISFWHKRVKDYDNVGNYAKSLMDINERVAFICKEAELPATQMALKFMVDLRSSGFHRLVMEWNEKYFGGQGGGGINGVDFPTFNAMVSEAIEEERRQKGEEEQQIQQQEILREEIDAERRKLKWDHIFCEETEEITP